MASCAKNPVSGMPDFVTITEQQEIDMGRAYHREILKNSKVLKNKELTKYYDTQHLPAYLLSLQFHFQDHPHFSWFARI